MDPHPCWGAKQHASHCTKGPKVCQAFRVNRGGPRLHQVGEGISTLHRAKPLLRNVYSFLGLGVR